MKYVAIGLIILVNSNKLNHKLLTMKNILILVLLLSLSKSINSQNRTQDSLYYLRINEVIKKNIKEGKFYENIQIFKKELGDTKYSFIFKSKIYNDIASNFGMAGQIDSAMFYTNLALAISEKMRAKNPDYYNSLINKGNILYSKGNLAEALTVNLTIADYFKKNNPERYTNVLITIGDILIKIRSFEDALDYLNKAQIEAQKLQNYDALYRINHNKAQLQYYKKRRQVDDLCIEHASNALLMAEKTSKANLIADAKSNLGTYLWKTGKLQDAIALLRSSDSFYTSRNISKLTLNLSLAKAFYSIGNYDISKQYFEKVNSASLPKLDKIENDFFYDALKNRSNYYNLFIQYKSAIDSINVDEVEKELVALDKKFKLLEKDNEISRLNEHLLINQLKAQRLEVDNLKHSAENEKILATKLKMDLELKENQIKQFESEQKILNLEAVQSIKQRTIKAQRNYLLGGGIGLIRDRKSVV